MSLAYSKCDACGKECHWSELVPVTAAGQAGSFCRACDDACDAVETLLRWAYAEAMDQRREDDQ